MNSILHIRARRVGETWMFDDRERGLASEPFVAGASEVISDLVFQSIHLKNCERLSRKNVEQRARGGSPVATEVPGQPTEVSLLFSAEPFPSALVKLNRVPGGEPGSFYVVEPLDVRPVGVRGRQCWLCPSTLKFFETFPETIYVEVKA